MVKETDASLRRFAFRLVGGDVDDVLQTAYLAAFRALSDFRGEASAGTWLHRIVYTTAMNHLRSRHRLFRRDSLGAVPERSGDLAVDVSTRLDLARAVASLPIEQRAVLLLVDGHGFSYAEAAQVVGADAGTVASRLNRARTRVRAALTEGSE